MTIPCQTTRCKLSRAMLYVVVLMCLAHFGSVASTDENLPLASSTLKRDSHTLIVRVRDSEFVRAKQAHAWTLAASPFDRTTWLRSMMAGTGFTTISPMITDAASQSRTSSVPHPGIATFLVGVPAGTSPEEMAAKLGREPWVEYAEVDRLLELHDVPNDPLWIRQWDLHNTGQPYWSIRGVSGPNNDSLIERTGIPGADIRFLDPYESAEPSADVLVGVVDSGIDTAHVDLRDRLALNPGEIPGNAIDDDRNGFIDDVFGWDFSGDELLPPLEIVGDNDITDVMGHGTHVAGTIAAIVDNAIGIAGVCPRARIVGARIFPNPFFSVSAQAIYYTVERGARVINMSWGGAFRSRAIEDALQYAHERGVVLVCSMGNSGRDEVFYPSGYATTIGVGASNARDQLSRFSTYNDFVDVVAPGEDILSLRAAGTDLYADVGEPGVHIIDSNYLIASGTSMSSPHAAGAAAVLLSFAPGLGNERVREILRSSADDIIHPYGGDSLASPGVDRYTGAGRINLARALGMLPGILVYVTSHPRGARLGTGDSVISGQIGGRNFAMLSAEISPSHPPLAVDWTPIPQNRITVENDRFEIRLSEVNRLAGPHTLRLNAGVDAVIDWPFWLGGETVARIDQPHEGDTVQSLRAITGSAYGPDFESFRISAAGPLPLIETHEIASDTRFRWFDTLAYWRTDVMTGGVYNVILDVKSAGSLTSDTVQVYVRDAFLQGFPVDLPSPAHFAVTTVDLDGVNGEEIICPSDNGLFVLQSNGASYPGWPRATEFDVSTAPAVADLDRDGKYEIIVASKSRLHVFAFIGEAFAGWPQVFLGSTGVFGNSLPIVGDVDGTGGLEVAAIDRHGRIKIWHANGQVYSPKGEEYYARIEADKTIGSSLPRLAIADLDRDGRNEIIAAADGLHVFDAITANAHKDNDSTFVLPLYSTHGMVVGDFNDDQMWEIAYVSTDGPTGRFTVSIVDGSGSPLDGWPRTLPLTVNQYLQYSLSAGDIDGDQIPELFLAPYSLGVGYLYAFHGNGSPVGSDSSNGLFATLPGTVSSIAVVNIDQDESAEIIMRVGDFISGPDRIFALKPDGQLAPGYPIIFGDGNSVTMPAPLIGDLDRDGMADMTTVQSTSSSVAVWQLGVPYSDMGRQWPKFSGDLWNSNMAITPRYDLVYLVRLTDLIVHGGYSLAPYEPTDLDCDGLTTVGDVIRLRDYLFASGQKPCRP